MPIFFENQLVFRDWLQQNHETANELIVGFYKVGSHKPSLTWSQSVDQALCFGWIDSVRKSIDHESYSIRFTPRKPNSIWSDINIKKIEELSKQGLMYPKGLEIFNLRKEEKSRIYSFEKEAQAFAEHLEQRFKNNSIAWAFFINQAPSYQKTLTHWVMAAKQETTKINRLDKLIAHSEAQKRLV